MLDILVKILEFILNVIEVIFIIDVGLLTLFTLVCIVHWIRGYFKEDED